MPDQLVSTATAARALGVSPRSLARWAQDGSVVPAVVTPGGWLRWDLADLRRQLSASGRTEGEPVVNTTTRPEPPPVVAAIVTRQDRLLLTWRHDNTPPVGFLSGEIEPGESAADAMIRECKEEAGLRVEAGPEIGRRVHPKTHRLMIYVAGWPVGDEVAEVGDAVELRAVRWATLAEADHEFAPYAPMFEPVHNYLVRTLG